MKAESPSKMNYRFPGCCPPVAVDIIIQCRNNRDSGYVFIERMNPPHGIAIPGGFVDYGESTYDAAVREAKEEVSLDVHLIRQLFTYSRPQRDPRQHVVSVAYVALAVGEPKAADDAKSIVWVKDTDIGDWMDNNKEKLVCDHYEILEDYLKLNYGTIQYLSPTIEEER